jgi:hypothetical protein
MAGVKNEPEAEGQAAAEAAPAFDPSVHLTGGAPAEGDPTVYLELCCSCGAVRRQRDPVSYIQRTLADWHARHNSAGHGAVSLADAVDIRRERSDAAHRAAGREVPERQRAISDYNTEVLAWPQTATDGQEG